MREIVDIPRDELFEFKKRNNLTAGGMALYFDVKSATMGGWLYRKHPFKMQQASYDIVMQKLGKDYVPVPEQAQHSENGTLPLIAAAIKGDAETCWLHYVSDVYPSDTEEKKVIIKYTHVNESTLKRWLNLMMPEGQNLLRLRCFLAHRGYDVAELEALCDVLRLLNYLIADRKITIGEAINKLGYHKEGALLQILLGRTTGISDKRLEGCRKLVQEYAIGRVKQQEELSTRTDHPPIKQENEKAPVSFVLEPHQEDRHISIRHMNGTRRWEVENLAALVRMMLPLAEHVLSDEYTEQDRERLRTLTNGDEVFRLSNVLNGLCGPRMRSHMMSKQEGE